MDEKRFGEVFAISTTIRFSSQTADGILLKWLQQMVTFGIALIENTPSTKSEVRKIAERVGFIKATHYGDEFMVSSKKGTTAFAYTPSMLQLHVDVPYYEQMPGVNMLHCVTQSSSGGANTLVDGFYVAELLREQNPNYFQVLSSVRVNWSDYGEESGIRHRCLLRAPVIWKCVWRWQGNKNQLQQHAARQLFTESVDDVVLWYEAFGEFVKRMHRVVACFKLSEGQILTFDNVRVLHGRSAYLDMAESSRCVVNVYVDWDQMFSNWRVLRSQQKSN